MEERKRPIFLGLRRKPIKPRDKELALFTEAAGALPICRGSEDAECLPVQVLETQADEWTQSTSVLQGISLKKRVRERKKERKKEKHGETRLLQWARPVTLFSKGTFIPWLVHRGKWKMQGHAESAQTLQQFCPYRNQDFFLHTFPINNVVYIIFWPWRPVDILWPSFDKGCSTRKFIFPWSVFSLYF